MYKIVFFIISCISWLLFSFLCRCRVTGLENVPLGGAVIAPNHQSFLDIPLIGFVLHKRRTHFMAKSELFHNPIFSWIIRTLLAFPVKRGTPDRTAIRYAIDILKQGDLVTIFPEGTRCKNGRMGDAEPGLVLIAAKAGVPIIPVGISGSSLIFSKAKWFPCLKIAIGKPIYINPGENTGKGYEDIGSRIMGDIRDLIDNEYNK